MSQSLRSWVEEGSVEIIVLALLASLIVVLALPLMSDISSEPVSSAIPVVSASTH